MFAVSDRGGEQAAATWELIETARLNGRDPDAYLRNVVTRIPDHPNSRLENQLPRHSLPICNRYTIGSNLHGILTCKEKKDTYNEKK
ncbi:MULTISPECIES: transposase domain-containing protein [Agrobacterium]|nr:hypothetical protein [Agrobacterium tumefaciens]NSY09161.1 transposase domain-containing protein [Agrobacterium tumefaciens]NSZ08939.1 transposase domain-containing protein [Agrobacterium tumefaciens]